MTPVQLIIAAIQLTLAISGFTLSFVVARRTHHEKRKEPFSVTDLQSVADSKWVTPSTREAARQELVRRSSSMEIRAQISNLGRVEEPVIEKLRFNYPGILKIKNNAEMEYFAPDTSDVGSMYVDFPAARIGCGILLLAIIATGWQLFFNTGGENPLQETIKSGIYASLFICSIAFLFLCVWCSLHRSKFTYRYISAVEELTGKKCKKNPKSVIGSRYSVGEKIASCPKIEQYV